MSDQSSPEEGHKVKMSTAAEQVTADAGAGAPALPLRKRKKEDSEEEDGPETTPDGPDAKLSKGDDGSASEKVGPMTKAREIRLEQNRKAARESRRRKKVMIEELQRSVIFFSRANSTLKQQNDELSQLLMQSQRQIAAIESGQQAAPQQTPQQDQNQQQPAPASQSQESSQQQQNQIATAPASQGESKQEDGNAFQQAQAQTVATQAVLESQVSPSSVTAQVYVSRPILIHNHLLLIPPMIGFSSCCSACRRSNNECWERFQFLGPGFAICSFQCTELASDATWCYDASDG